MTTFVVVEFSCRPRSALRRSASRKKKKRAGCGKVEEGRLFDLVEQGVQGHRTQIKRFSEDKFAGIGPPSIHFRSNVHRGRSAPHLGEANDRPRRASRCTATLSPGEGFEEAGLNRRLCRWRGSRRSPAGRCRLSERTLDTPSPARKNPRIGGANRGR